MAKAKKSKPVASKSKPARKTAATKRSAPKKPAIALSADKRSTLLRSRSGADDLGEAISAVWQAERGVRVEGLTSKRLLSFVSRLRKAKAKEAALADAQARKMAPVRDARMIADDALWRALLDLRASVALKARKDPAVEERFADLIDALTNTAPANDGPSGSPAAS